MGQLRFEGCDGVGKGKKIVLVAGDEEYRSEESCPMLAKILSERYGFDCAELFSMSADGSYIDPNNQKNITGLDELSGADLMIIGTRFRQLESDDYAKVAAYLNAGKPVIGFRTATHAFSGGGATGDFKWAEFGPKILGEGWVNHHGKHKSQGARGKVEEANAKHPILNGVSDVFGPSDVYGIKRVTAENATILLRGIVTDGLMPDSKAVEGGQNNPMMPLAWLREYTSPDGKAKGQAFCTTMGASADFESEGLRRLVVNAALHLTGQEVPAKGDVSYLDSFTPSFYSFIKEKDFYKNRNLQPIDSAMGSFAATGLPENQVPKNWKSQAVGHPTAAVDSSVLPFGEPEKGSRFVIIGNGLGDGFQRHGYFEAFLQTAYSGKELIVRNLCHPGFTAGFRPHPSRKSQWAFPGAEKFRPEFQIHSGNGYYPTQDEWLTTLRADTILGFFGFNESFDGKAGEAAFEGELRAFADHTLVQNYSGKGEPRLILVSPIAPESWIENYDERVAALTAYTDIMRQVAAEKKVGFINLFDATQQSKELGGSVIKTPYGVVPDDEGYRWLSVEMLSSLFAAKGFEKPVLEKVRTAVAEKNWHWMNDYRMPNGVHVYGRRYKPFGNENYPKEIQKNREMTEVRDRAIWATALGEDFDVAAADAQTTELAKIETNYKPSAKNGSKEYLYGQDAVDSLVVPDGFKIELFADERQFPNLANPVQMAFDNKGSLWIATMPSYPHSKPGDAKPDDKILIYEDTNNDGKADKETVFVDKLSLPMDSSWRQKESMFPKRPILCCFAIPMAMTFATLKRS